MMTEPPTLGTFNDFEVYPMPMFATLEVPDLEAAIAWYQAALGFGAMFVAREPGGRPTLAHLRRAKYQDLLLVPGEGVTSREKLAISLQANGDPAELATRARSAAACGASSVEGPIDTPWNTTDVRLTDPAGHRLVLTAPRAVADPELAAKMKAWLDRGRTP